MLRDYWGIKLPVMLSFFCFCSNAMVAQELKGHVYDKSSGEQLIGASVVLKPTSQKTSSSVSGAFSFKNITAGSYNIRFSYVGFSGFDTTLVIGSKALSIDVYLSPKGSKLSDVIIVSTGNGGTEEYAKRREQVSSSIINVISAKSIAISPDITVANVMQRISGVSIERSSSGDGQYAIIRGMDKRYNTTLINGVKIPSPDSRNRYVPLDIFPADLIERIEVIKSLTPDMEGDAAGGVVNLVMKNAPDKFKAEGNIGTGYSQLFLNRNFLSYSSATVNAKSPAEINGPNVLAPVAAFPYNNLVTAAGKPPVNKNFSLTVGDRFFQNKLGVIFSGSYQNSYRGSNSNVLLQSQTVPPAANNTLAQQPAVSDVYYREYSSRFDRSGVETKIDYNFNKDNSISLFATYLQLDERRVRFTSDTLLGGYTTKDHFIGPYAIYHSTETRNDLQSILNGTLQGKNALTKGLVADWSLALSEAKRELPDLAEFNIGYPVNANTSAGTFTLGNPQTEAEHRSWIHNTDKDLAGYLNLNYKKTVAGRTANFGLGGMYRHKERDNFADDYKLTPVSDRDSVYQKFVSIPAAQFQFTPANLAAGNSQENPGVYHALENVAAGYAQAKYNLTGKIEITGGVRAEHTHQYYLSSLNRANPGWSADINYLDILPSLHAKYVFTERKALRFSYFRSIFRPAFVDLVPFGTGTGANDTYSIQGNPNVKHTVIDNFDLRYELFPKGLDQFMVGAFYKILDNPIEYAIGDFSNTSGTYSASGVLSPQNFGVAHNFGLELVFRKYFGDFGVSGNYTYTHSVINATKLYVYLSPNGNTNFTKVEDSRPLQGQSAHIGNFSLLYKNQKNKIEAQLALVYTGQRINLVTAYKGFDNWEKATTNLDFSVQKELGNHYIIYIKANNLLNTPFQIVIKQHNNAFNTSTRLPFQQSVDYMTVQYDRFYAAYSLGFRFKF
ncbi:MAG: TonB-dependent receptor [Ferruginibacter sp.]